MAARRKPIRHAELRRLGYMVDVFFSSEEAIFAIKEAVAVHQANGGII